MFVVSAFIALIEEVPVVIADVLALRPSKGDACTSNFFTFLPDFFSLFLG